MKPRSIRCALRKASRRFGLALVTLGLTVAAAGALAAVPGAEAPNPQSLAPLRPAALDCDRRLGSASFLLTDGAGHTLAALRPDAPRPVGSITKLMTARIVLKAGGLGKQITVPPLRLHPDESRAGLRHGMRLTRRMAISALLVPSGNDAAEALAATGGFARAGFVRAMNREAARLGLTHTTYANPSGIPDPAQASTARDSLRLARVLMRDGRFRAIVRQRSVRLGEKVLATRNPLLGRVPGVDGVKTGTLNGDFSIVVSATGRGGRVFAAALGAPSAQVRERDAQCLLSVGRRMLTTPRQG